MQRFRVYLKHDKGLAKATITASSEEEAIKIIMAADRCPRSAIVKVITLADKKGKLVTLSRRSLNRVLRLVACVAYQEGWYDRLNVTYGRSRRGVTFDNSTVSKRVEKIIKAGYKL